MFKKICYVIIMLFIILGSYFSYVKIFENKKRGSSMSTTYQSIPILVLVDAYSDFLIITSLNRQSEDFQNEYNQIMRELNARIQIIARSEKNGKINKLETIENIDLNRAHFNHFTYITDNKISPSLLAYAQSIHDLINIANAAHILVEKCDDPLIRSHLEGIISKSILSLRKAKPLQDPELFSVYNDLNVAIFIDELVVQYQNLEQIFELINKYPDGNEPYGFVPLH